MILRNHISILLLLATTCANGQVLSKLGRFSIEFERGCNPSTVHVTKLDTFGNVSRQYFYQNDNNASLDTLYTYNNPGTYEIVQFVGEDIEPKSDTLIFIVDESPIPDFNLFNCTDTSFNLLLADSYYDFYQISSIDTSFITSQSSSNLIRKEASSISVKGFLNNAFTEGCPLINAFIPVAETYARPTIDTLTIVETCKNQYLLTLKGSFDFFNKYRLSYDLDNTGSFQTFYEGVISDSLSIFIPTRNIDFNNYCIQIETLNACNNRAQNNFIVCGTTSKHEDELSTIYASYSGSNIFIEIPESINEYVISRSANRGVFSVLDTVNGRFFDQNVFENRFYQYQVLKLDTCGNTLWSIFIAPPFQAVISKDRVKNILYTDQVKPEFEGSISDSLVIIYNQDSAVTISQIYSNEIFLAAGLGNIQSFRTAYQNDFGQMMYSNELRSSYKLNIYAPKAFTPNNDGLNDEFVFFGLPELEGILFIFDRWGRNIFKTDQASSGWNGYYKNEIAPPGTYRYKIQFNIEGQFQEQVGSFVLIRN